MQRLLIVGRLVAAEPARAARGRLSERRHPVVVAADTERGGKRRARARSGLRGSGAPSAGCSRRRAGVGVVAAREVLALSDPVEQEEAAASSLPRASPSAREALNSEMGPSSQSRRTAASPASSGAHPAASSSAEMPPKEAPKLSAPKPKPPELAAAGSGGCGGASAAAAAAGGGSLLCLGLLLSSPGGFGMFLGLCSGRSAGCMSRARRAVVLAAGAVGSPHILQASGVGPAALLASKGVTPLLDLPGVGQNLHDHLQIRASFRLKEGTLTLNHWTKAGSLVGQALMGAQYLLNRTGPLAMAPSQLGIFAKSSPEEQTPDLQFHVQPLSLEDLADPDSLHKFPGITASVCNLRPTSRGALTLRSPDTKDPPAIDPNYLDTPRDRAVAASSLRLARRLVLGNASSSSSSSSSSSRFAAKYAPSEHAPGAHLESDEDLARAAGDIASSIFHPVGTCAMGASPALPTCSGRAGSSVGELPHGAVVDPALKVFGVANLRVADASVMPSITSGNTNSPTLAIAEKAAEMLLRDHARDHNQMQTRLGGGGGGGGASCLTGRWWIQRSKYSASQTSGYSCKHASLF
eukprot:CAMPEP_0172645794 /NCGR_PEP_ID=MMETSP1068-20121228/239913_1 /TAXON_ID=35684 /ORGANISM="Pseudopedinella elastica, Strain CCMP716" /LENGTH=579 /DNA_ID=CAMNT_0013460043 /DNA_START=292 /DNA_END=2032 /DNA_ORIENTATION=+